METAPEIDYRELARGLVPDVFDCEYVPWDPNPAQALALLCPAKEMLFGGSAGGGKRLALDTPIPTPSGWTTMGELRDGDVIFDERGHETRVVKAHPVDLRPASRRVVFDDGSAIDACDDHLWHTYTAADLSALTTRTPEYRARRRAKRPSRATGSRSPEFTAALTARNQAAPPPTLPPPAGAVRTTREIAETLLTPRGRRNHAIPVAGALDLPEGHPLDLILDPYLLGAWLGDGTSLAGAITTADPEILDAFRAAGFTVTKRKGGPYGYGILGLRAALCDMGVLGNKHVPPAYLRASKAQRLALLQGLMDTDGTACRNGSVEFTSTTRCLADAACELAISLGHKAAVREGLAKLDGRVIGPKYRVKWTAADPVFRLPRKLARQKTTGLRRTTRFRYIVSCERIEPRPMRCITVDSPSNLYLCGRSMIPTHNTIYALMEALRYVHVPRFSALILRKTYSDLDGDPNTLIPLSKEWLNGTDAAWNEVKHNWTFPSGARLQFGYLDGPNDHLQYLGKAFQLIIVDELTQHRENQYRFLFRSLRKPNDGPLADIPLKMRSTSNPGGPGHGFVKKRFIDEPYDDETGQRRVFIPAKLADNPKLDAESYIASLMNLDPVTRRQQLDGDWTARHGGSMFRREWFEVVDEIPQPNISCRGWDLAATTGEKSKRTAGVRVAKGPDVVKIGNTWLGVLYITHAVAFKLTPGARDEKIAHTAGIDGREVIQRVEVEPGSGGIKQAEDLVGLLSRHWVKPEKPTGSKFVRAGPWASRAELGGIKIVRGPWNEMLLDELEGASEDVSVNDQYLDLMDALSSACEEVDGKEVVTAPSTPDEEAEEKRERFDGLGPDNRGSGRFW